jgi:hypothetical protein
MKGDDVDVLGVLPAAAAAVRHAASASIRTEPAGHSLLPAAPDTYAPAHDSTHARPLGRAAAAVYPSDPSGTGGSTREYPGGPSSAPQTHGDHQRCLRGTLESTQYCRSTSQYPLGTAVAAASRSAVCYSRREGPTPRMQ